MTGISSAELGGIGVRHDTYCCGTWNMKEEVAQRNLSDILHKWIAWSLGDQCIVLAGSTDCTDRRELVIYNEQLAHSGSRNVNGQSVGQIDLCIWGMECPDRAADVSQR